MLQRHPIQKLHGNESLLPVFANFVDGANIRMVKRRRRPRLPPKTLQGLRIARKFLRQKFEGHETAKFRILSLVNHTHAAATELLDNAVVRDGLADHLVPFESASSYGRGIRESTRRPVP